MNPIQAEDILRANFAPWVLDLQLKVTEVSSTSATLAIARNDKLHRDGGMVSGQALMALADTAMVVALFGACNGFRLLTTVDMNTTFMRPAIGGVIAEATILRFGKTMAFCQARLFMDTPERQLVANAVGTYALLGASINAGE